MVCTGGHPFYVVGMGFILAKNLKANEKLLLSDGKEVIIEKVEVETLTKAETTYNFEVADFHTYYVSDCKVLVHNMCQQGKRFTENQQAVNDLANEAKRTGGLTAENGKTLMDWADEYGMPARGPEISARPGIWHDTPHYHIGRINHIPLK